MVELFGSKPLMINGKFNKDVIAQFNDIKDQAQQMDLAAISLREQQDRATKEILKNKEHDEKLAFDVRYKEVDASISAPKVVDAAEEARKAANILELSRLEESIKSEPLATDYANLIKRYQKDQAPAQRKHSENCRLQDDTYNALVREANAALNKSLESQKLKFRKELRPEQNKDVAEAWATAENNDRNAVDSAISVYAEKRDILKGESAAKVNTFQEWIDKQTGLDFDLQKVAIIAKAIETARERVDQDAGRAKSFEEQNVLLSKDYKNKFEGQVEVNSNLNKLMEARTEDQCVIYCQSEPSRIAKIVAALKEQDECRKNGTKWEEKPYKTGSRDTIRDEGNKIIVELYESYDKKKAIADASFLAMQKWGVVKPDANASLEFHTDVAKACAEFDLNFQSPHKDVQRFFENSCDLHKISKLTKERPFEDVDQITREVEEARRLSREKNLKMEEQRQMAIDNRVDFFKYKSLLAENPEIDRDSAMTQVLNERKEINAELKKKNNLEASEQPERKLTKNEQDYIHQQCRIGRQVSIEQLDERERDRKAYEGKIDRESFVPKLSDDELKEKYEKRSREISARAKYEIEQKNKSRELNH